MYVYTGYQGMRAFPIHPPIALVAEQELSHMTFSLFLAIYFLRENAGAEVKKYL
jgi:hypothetical protein